MPLVATIAGGLAVQTAPDVCKTPPWMEPIPYPNEGLLPIAVDTAENVLVENMATITVMSELPTSIGDEPGVGGGVVSGTVMNIVRFTVGSSKVFAAGQPVVYMGSITAHNGASPNTVGVVAEVAQTVVITAP